MLIRLLLSLASFSVIAQTGSSASQEHFLVVLEKGLNGTEEAIDVVLDLLYEAHPSFFVNDDEVERLKTEFHKAQLSNEGFFSFIFKLDQAKYPTIFKKREEILNYIEKTDSTEIVTVLNETLSETSIASNCSSYRTVIEEAIKEYEAILSEINQHPLSFQKELFDNIASIKKLAQSLRGVLQEYLNMNPTGTTKGNRVEPTTSSSAYISLALSYLIAYMFLFA